MMEKEGVYFKVGLLEDGDGFAELVDGREFDAADAAKMLAALINHLMNSEIDPTVFQSSVVGILATMGPEG